jgi:hypothetical protein
MMKSEKLALLKWAKLKQQSQRRAAASKRADGIAVKGKTKGKMMAGGGMAKMKSGGAC